MTALVKNCLAAAIYLVRAPKSKPAPSPMPLVLQEAPIYTLPVELIQEITSYLQPSSAASFALSARYIYYAVGSGHLQRYLQSGDSKIQRRQNIEILERAFPSKWYCAWCDKFHARDQDGGPKNGAREAGRQCAKFNSYLHFGSKYVLRYHHVRLAVNHELWGPEYGLPLESFGYHDEQGTAKVLKQQVDTAMWCEAKMRNGHLVLHATFKIWLPMVVMRNPEWLNAVWPALPQIVVGHRDSHHGHTGLKAALRSRMFEDHMQLCSLCATDFLVHRAYVRGDDGQRWVLILIDTYRDLGDGRSPFNLSWRAHGEIGDAAPGFGGDVMRLAGYQTGDIKKAFEEEGSVEKGEKAIELQNSLSELHKRHQRTESFLSGELSLTREIVALRIRSDELISGRGLFGGG